MAKRSKYRVQVIVDNHSGFQKPETKYVIQSKDFLFWHDEHDATADKDWAYKTCEEMNTNYETIRNKKQ